MVETRLLILSKPGCAAFHNPDGQFGHSRRRDHETGTGGASPVYEELRQLAHYHLRQQRPNHTLQTTALVHEAYLKLSQEKFLRVENHAHFLGIAAQLMRWILVDNERSRHAAKRGAGVTRLTLSP